MLILLIGTFLLFPLLSGPTARVLSVIVIGGILLLALRTSGVGRRWLTISLVAVVAAVILTLGASLLEGERPLTSAVVGALLIIPPILAIGRRLVTHPKVTAQTVLGAINIYFLLGLLAAYVFIVIDQVTAGPFFVTGPVDSPFEYLYFSFVTLTTLGYGDLAPAINIGRSVAMFEAFVGQIFLVTMVARLVSLWTIPARLRQMDDA